MVSLLLSYSSCLLSLYVTCIGIPGFICLFSRDKSFLESELRSGRLLFLIITSVIY
jgi:hypothetical protein